MRVIWLFGPFMVALRFGILYNTRSSPLYDSLSILIGRMQMTLTFVWRRCLFMERDSWSPARLVPKQSVNNCYLIVIFFFYMKIHFWFMADFRIERIKCFKILLSLNSCQRQNSLHVVKTNSTFCMISDVYFHYISGYPDLWPHFIGEPGCIHTDGTTGDLL